MPAIAFAFRKYRFTVGTEYGRRDQFAPRFVKELVEARWTWLRRRGEAGWPPPVERARRARTTLSAADIETVTHLCRRITALINLEPACDTAFAEASGDPLDQRL
jgi:hypothetical protein